MSGILEVDGDRTIRASQIADLSIGTVDINQTMSDFMLGRRPRYGQRRWYGLRRGKEIPYEPAERWFVRVNMIDGCSISLSTRHEHRSDAIGELRAITQMMREAEHG